MYRNLRIKIICLTLMVSVAPLVILGGVIYQQFSEVCEQKVRDQIRQLARSQSNAIDVFLRERTNILMTIVNTHTIDELSRQADLSRLFNVLTRQTQGLGLIDIGIIGEDGSHLAYVGPYDLAGLNYAQQPWFGITMNKGSYISDVYLGFRQLPHFIIAVRGHTGYRHWILRATIDSDVFNSLVRTAQAGKTADAFILNRAGVYQTQPRFEGTILEASALDPRTFGEGTTLMDPPPSGMRTAFIAGSWLKNGEWLFVATQQTCDEAGWLARARSREIAIIITGCLAIVLATILIVHMTVNRLEKTDRERDRLTSQLQQSDKLAALGKMAAGIAHEINNPLAVIGENAGWIKDLLAEEELRTSPNFLEFEKSAEKIETHVERARKITHNMLGFARRMEPRLDDVDVNHTLDEVISLLENHARTNNIEIQTVFHENLPVIASDQSQLQQVFLNLMNNAIDAIGKDGLIDVLTRPREDTIEVEIRDDGPGIPKGSEAKIFDPFYTTKHNGKGTGLGLSITYSIIEKMGGSIRFERREPRGTAFFVNIPVIIPEKK
ncbi:MAG: two-component sensor histidine kinase [Deltaproteobacteria bacterium]|nr:two-component sensor histidine kinase [Deltaproteobacteria bacterium]